MPITDISEDIRNAVGAGIESDSLKNILLGRLFIGWRVTSTAKCLANHEIGMAWLAFFSCLRGTVTPGLYSSYAMSIIIEKYPEIARIAIWKNFEGSIAALTIPNVVKIAREKLHGTQIRSKDYLQKAL